MTRLCSDTTSLILGMQSVQQATHCDKSEASHDTQHDEWQRQVYSPERVFDALQSMLLLPQFSDIFQQRILPSKHLDCKRSRNKLRDQIQAPVGDPGRRRSQLCDVLRQQGLKQPEIQMRLSS